MKAWAAVGEPVHVRVEEEGKAMVCTLNGVEVEAVESGLELEDGVLVEVVVDLVLWCEEDVDDSKFLASHKVLCFEKLPSDLAPPLHLRSIVTSVDVHGFWWDYGKIKEQNRLYNT